MKNLSKLILIISLITLVYACSQNRKEKMAEIASPKKESTEYNDKVTKEEEGYSSMEKSVSKNSNGSVTYEWSNLSGNSVKQKDAKANQFISSSAAVENAKDTVHKFIRTADLKFKAESVVNATYAIENIIREKNGFVSSTNLSSKIDYVTTTSVSLDSSVESTYYTVVNEMILRVPNTKLDTTLKSIAVLIDYLDYRNIKAEDVALKILANKLARERAAKSEQRLKNAIDTHGKKLSDMTEAEEMVSAKQEAEDNATIENLSIQDQINFSTIRLSIYQRQALKRELISNNKNIDAFSPGFGKRMADALKSGWDVLIGIIVFIAQIWELILITFVGYYLYKVIGRRFKK